MCAIKNSSSCDNTCELLILYKRSNDYGIAN
nr:MAG TPA: hypothetical protein [Caudoviricetes sp.]